MKVESGKWKVESWLTRKLLRVALAALSLSTVNFQLSTAQNINPKPGERIAVRGGIAEISAENKARVNLAAMTPDSLYRFMAAVDSLRADGVRFDRTGTD